MPDQKTTAFIAAAIPRHAEVAAAVESFRTSLEQISDAGVAESRLLMQADDAEPDVTMRAHFEEAHQKYGAIARITDTLQREMRNLVAAHRELSEVNGRIREQAETPAPLPTGENLPSA